LAEFFFFLLSAKKLLCREPFIGRSAKPSLPSVFFALDKEISLPRAIYRTLGKAFFAECTGFAECFLFGSRQSLLC
jgi:hypothetical protein